MITLSTVFILASVMVLPWQRTLGAKLTKLKFYNG